MPTFPKHHPRLPERGDAERRLTLQDPLLSGDPDRAMAQIDGIKDLEDAKTMIKRLLRMVRSIAARQGAG